MTKRSSISDRDAAHKSFGRIFVELAEDAITAAAGGGQANAYPLNAQTNRITVVATAGDSVMLPPAVLGYEISIINAASKPVQVFGVGTDTVNGVAAATGVSQMALSTVIYSCGSPGLWHTEGLASGYSGSYATASYKDAITAHAGGTQAGAIGDAAAQLPAMINRITTVGTAADSVVLPLAVPGMSIVVANAAAANSLNVFPFTGDAIDAGAANAAKALAAAKSATFYCTAAGFWHSILSA